MLDGLLQNCFLFETSINRSERLLLLLPLWLRPWTYGAPRFNGYEKWPISSRRTERKQLSRRAAWSFAPRVPQRATILRDFPFVEHVQTYTIVYKYLDNLWRQWKNIIKLYGCLELNCNFWSYVVSNFSTLYTGRLCNN